jgi:hypothetical protein
VPMGSLGRRSIDSECQRKQAACMSRSKASSQENVWGPGHLLIFGSWTGVQLRRFNVSEPTEKMSSEPKNTRLIILDF